MLRIQTKSPNNKGINASLEKELTDRINTYLQAEDFASAYPLIVRLREISVPTCQTCNIAGLIAVRLGKHEEARQHFQFSLESDPQGFDAQYNIALIDMMAGRYSDASGGFRKLVLLRPREAALRNDLGAALVEQKRGARALAAFSKALKLDPNFSQARNNALEHCLQNDLTSAAKHILDKNERSESLSAVSKVEISRWRQILDSPASVTNTTGIPVVPTHVAGGHSGKPRLAFFANHDSFVTAIREELAQEYEIELYDGGGAESMTKLLERADISWFEWCDDLVIQASRLPRRSVMLCRLHSYEAFTDMPEKVNWKNIDHLLFVNESVKQLVAPRVPATLSQSVIYNGVDLSRFNLDTGKPESKKIASVGYINYKKNPTLLLYCFKKLHEYDPEYSLHIAGSHQDARIQLYFDHFLKQNPLPVYFDGWIDDMPGWYADKGWVISTSLFESFHYSIAEGMASGLLPLIHNWFGAGQLYPTDYLFNDPDQFLALVQSLENRDRVKLLDLNRKFIADRYSHNEKTREIKDLLRLLLTTHHQTTGAFV